MARKLLDLRRGIKLALALTAVALVAATAAFAAGTRSHASDTLVFGASADPVSMDGAVISDGESVRAIKQVLETLIAQAPGTTEPDPGSGDEVDELRRTARCGRSPCVRG